MRFLENSVFESNCVKERRFKRMCSNRALVFNRRTELYLGGRVTVAKSTLVSAGVLFFTALVEKNLKYSFLGKKWMSSHDRFEKIQCL